MSIRSALRNVPLQVRVITLGMLSYALCVGLPWLYRPGPTQVLDWVALLLSPCLLAAGSVLSRRAHPAGSFILLSAFPIALSFGISRVPHERALSMFSPFTLMLMLLSVGSYGSAASQASYAQTRLRRVVHRSLDEVVQVATTMRRRQAARLVLSTLTIGALSVLVFASSATPAHYREQWGQAAHAGAVVAALAAGLAGCGMLALLTPGLRAARSDAGIDPDRKKRLSWLLLVAVSGLTLYGVVR